MDMWILIEYVMLWVPESDRLFGLWAMY